MSGETNLDAMLAGLTVSRRLGLFTVTTVDPADATDLGLALGSGIEAVIREGEGTTVVCTVEVAKARGWVYDFEAAWLTLDVHSALEGVGLTAAFSTALASQGIACNVVAGYFHDHLLVPANRAEDAFTCLTHLAQQQRDD